MNSFKLFWRENRLYMNNMLCKDFVCILYNLGVIYEREIKRVIFFVQLYEINAPSLSASFVSENIRWDPA